jgi:hypothetical protein
LAEQPGAQLQRALRERVVSMLGALRDELDALGALALPPAGPEWDGTALAGRLRTPIGGVALGPFTTALLATLRQMTGGAPDGVIVSVHGWHESPDMRGLAWAGRAGSAPGALAFAVHVVAAADGPRLGLTASGATEQPVRAVLGAGWSIAASGRIGGELRLVVGPDGDVAVAGGDDGDVVRIELERTADARRLGAPPGPSMQLGPATVVGEVRLAGGRLHRAASLRLPNGTVKLAPTGLATLVPGLGPIPLTLDIGLDGERGMTLGGSTELRTRIPVGMSMPGVALDAIDVSVRPGATAGAATELGFAVRAAARITIPGAPIELRFDGLGLDVPVVIGDAPVRGIDVSRLSSLAPSGASVGVDLPVVRAGGVVSEVRRGEYAGALTASIPPMSASAFGILATDPFSFLVVLGATFPPPGIQVGFGFAVSGIGGIVGVGRRVDRQALLRAVTDGTAANLMFPTDAAGAAAAVGRALPALFPPARGAVVAGPMFQLSWGGRIATASVALLVEVAPRPRTTIIGKLVLALPDPAAAMVLIQVTFAGQLDPGEPSVLIVASMQGSHVVGVPITGDVCLLTRGGPDATFVLSAGGFHPAFPLPRGVPPLARIGMDLSPLPLLELRAEGYFAVTTNTVQFGARIELVAEVAECGLRGHLGLDVLVQLEPFRFVADVSIGIALTVLGEELVGVALDLTLEGPAKWRARGRGSIDLFLFSVSFDFDEQWGSAPPLALTPPNVGAELAKALADPGAWVVHRSSRGLPGIVLTSAADRQLGRSELVDPYGSLSVRQRRVPLGLGLDRFDRIPLPARETWDVVNGRLGTSPAPSQGELREPFAAAQFLALTDDQQLARPAYEPFRAGMDLVAAGVVVDTLTPHTIEIETKLIVDPFAPSIDVGLAVSLLAGQLEIIAASATIDDASWWDGDVAPVTVADATPLTIASSWALTEVPMSGAGPTAAEMFDAIGNTGRTDLMVVEAWETR